MDLSVPAIERCCEGIVIIRQSLSIEEQLRLIDIIERNSVFKDQDKNWNFFGVRGRYFSNLDKYTDHEEDSVFLKECFARFRNLVVATDTTLDWAPATHMLTFWYVIFNYVFVVVVLSKNQVSQEGGY